MSYKLAFSSNWTWFSFQNVKVTRSQKIWIQTTDWLLNLSSVTLCNSMKGRGDGCGCILGFGFLKQNWYCLQLTIWRLRVVKRMTCEIRHLTKVIFYIDSWWEEPCWMCGVFLFVFVLICTPSPVIPSQGFWTVISDLASPDSSSCSCVGGVAR